MKKIFSGLEDSGKSYLMSVEATRIVKRNSYWYGITGVKRPIYTCMDFSADFVDWAAELNVPIIRWHHLRELVLLRDADIFFDEIGTYFDSRLWPLLSFEVRRWLPQASKVGVDMYGTCQDFAQIDLSFRRLTNELVSVVKLFGSRRPTPSRPPVGKIWGLCLTWALDPVSYSEEKKKVLNFLNFPGFFFLRKKYCDVFDTTQRQEKAEAMPLDHLERICPICGKVEVKHL